MHVIDLIGFHISALLVDLLFYFSCVVFPFLLGRLQDLETTIYTITMPASDKTLGLRYRDLEDRPMDHDVLQQAQVGADAGTVLDDDDMHRMGRVQEFKACLSLPLHCIDFSHSQTEKSTTIGCIEFCFGPASDLGISSNVSNILQI